MDDIKQVETKNMCEHKFILIFEKVMLLSGGFVHKRGRFGTMESEVRKGVRKGGVPPLVATRVQ